MKTCRLYTTSFVSPLEFLSSEVFYELLLILLNIIPADVKVASLINPANLKKEEFENRLRTCLQLCCCSFDGP